MSTLPTGGATTVKGGRAGGQEHVPGAASVLAGVRRLTALADSDRDGEAVFGALARELIEVMGADEVHIHHLGPAGKDEPVVVYVLHGDGRLSYLQPHEQRPPGVSWVASTARSFLAG